MGFPTMWYVRPAKPQIRLIRAFASRLNSMCHFKLLTEHRLEILCLKGGSTCSSESTFVKMIHFWKSHVAAQLFFSEEMVVCLVLTLSSQRTFPMISDD